MRTDTAAPAGEEMTATRFLITGGQLHGNLGAAAMSIVTVDCLRREFPDAEILFVSKYPHGERKNVLRFFGSDQTVCLIPVSQVQATFLHLPLMLVATMVRAQHSFASVSGLLKGFCESDVIIDIGGITFSEERGLIGLVINATWVLLSILAGKPMVKLSQAFGPIHHRWFRVISRALLRRVAVLVARGKRSLEELRSLGLSQKSWECADLAFTLHPEVTGATRRLESSRGGMVVGVAPSSVLYQKCGGETYVAMMAEAIELLLRNYADASVWLLAHAFRAENTLSNNDGPVCEEIYGSLCTEARSRTRLIVGNYTPAEMRTIVGKTEVFLACRFHAMVSALASGVPVAVIGWSHKYREVQAQFNLDYCIDYRTANAESISQIMDDLIQRQDSIREKILTALPEVSESSAKNFDVLVAFVCNNKPQP